MKVNSAKEIMLSGKPAFGYALSLGAPLNAELLSNCGIDFLLLDRQHGSWGEDSTIAAFSAMAAGAAVPMARVARNDYTLIGRLLDEGALGIIVPMVHTPEDAQAAAQRCRYPPVGDRSWGWGRAWAYGADYTQWIGEQLFVAVQIESALAVENAEAIMATPGVDGCWLGPSDLSFSLGFHPSEMNEREEHPPRPRASGGGVPKHREDTGNRRNGHRGWNPARPARLPVHYRRQRRRLHCIGRAQAASTALRAAIG